MPILNSPSIAKTPDFVKFWESAHVDDPTDQVISAYNYGLNTGLLQGRREIEFLILDKTTDNVDESTKLIKIFFEELKNEDPDVQMFLKINSPFAFEFLILLSEKYFSKNKDKIYKEGLELEDVFRTSTSSMIIHFKPLMESTSIELIQQDGYNLSFKG